MNNSSDLKEAMTEVRQKLVLQKIKCSVIEKYLNLQGLGSLGSDLDVTKACEAIQIPGMIIGEDEFIMSHVSW